MVSHHHNASNFSRLFITWSTTLMVITSLFTSAKAYGIEISATIDRDPIALDESFQLTFTANQSPDDDPDFSPLEQHFDILNQSQSSNVSLINGKVARAMVWTLTLIAKREGQLAIPAIAFGSDTSSALSVLVKSTAGNGSPRRDRGLFIETEISSRNPYVQSQVIYTIRIFRNIEITQASLGDPVLDNAVIEKLGEDSSYYTQRGGRRYAVIERKFAIFPQQSGDQTIAPIELNAEVVSNDKTTGRFQRFFRRQMTKARRVRSEAIALKVKRIPLEFKGRHWLPAKMLHVEQKWSESPPRITAGEPITRTLTLLAKGASVNQLPELHALASHTDHIRYYPDQPALNEKREANGIVAFREEKTALIPNQAGEYSLPAIEIPWWNTVEDRMEVATIPKTTLTVLPVAGHHGKPAQSIAPEVKPVEITDSQVKTGLAVTSNTPNDFWKWVSLLLGMGWIGTLLLVFFRAKKVKEIPPREILGPDEKQALKALKKACGQNDPLRTRTALLTWAKARWGNTGPTSLDLIGRRIGGDLTAEITRLNNVLYSPSEIEWSGEALWQAFKKAEKTAAGETKDNAGDLEPLYRT